jgi:topoisomerase-4 subunit A
MTDTTDERVEDVPFDEALSQRYLAYALSTIVSRSLPDVRDGLKPVHRRLLYAMLQLRLDPGAGFKKCARVVGDVIGKFHPHGDSAVYEALVRLAQDFAARYPLVDGQGNFGTVDGDNAAAMRYTEARLTTVAQALLDGIDEDAVDFRRTYDGEEEEPVVLPARFPNLLANGAAGIAVGMATSIPPHNVAELCAALRHLIRHPRAEVASLMELMPGPDFPTGGVLVEGRDSLVAAYRTGRGSFRLRARWHAETTPGGGWRIVVTEIPYQVAKGRLIEKLAELLATRRLPLIADLRDESTDVVRVVIEPTKGAGSPEAVMDALFRASELQVRIGLNMNVLDGGLTPRLMDLRDVLKAFLDHRHEVLVRRSRHRLAVIDRRIEVLAGFLVVFARLEEVIQVIREADDVRVELMRRFSLSEVQADAVLNMRLRQLRRLDEAAMHREHDQLTAERADLAALLADDKRRWRAIDGDLAALAREFGPDTALGRRRTTIAEATVEAPPIADATEEGAGEPLILVCSDKGWVRTLRGAGAAAEEVTYKKGDGPRFAVRATTADRMLMFASDGRFFSLSAGRLPGDRGDGEPLRLLVDLDAGAGPVAWLPFRSGQRLIVASDAGRGFLVDADDVVAHTRAGKQVLTLQADERAAACAVVADDADHVAIVGTNRRLLVFPLTEVPAMTRGRGVILQRYRQARLADLTVLRGESGLVWRTARGTSQAVAITPWLGRRGAAGTPSPRNFPSSNRFG